MKRYLATTKISEIWDFDADLLLLGPWCLIKDNKYIKNSYSLIPPPWKPVIKIKEAADYCHQIYVEILPAIAKQLNSLHNVSYPVRYWQILLGPWLLTFIGIVYDRYRRIEVAIKLFPDLYTHVLPQEECDLTSINTLDCFRSKVNNDIYNLRLFSVINREIYPSSIVGTTFIPALKDHFDGYNYSWRAKIFNYFAKDILSMGDIIFVEMYHLNNFDKLVLKYKLGFNKIGFMDFVKENKLFSHNLQLNKELRHNIDLAQDGEDRFKSLLFKIIPSAIPRCYVEGYGIYSGYIDTVKHINKIKILGSSIGWQYDEVLKFLGAKLTLNGTKLVEFQHGGGYDTYFSNPQETLSLEKDTFYMWGMHLEEKVEKIKYLPSPYLSRIKDSYLKNNYYLLFINTRISIFQFRLISYFLPEDVERYIEDRKLFLSILDEKIRDSVLYRPSPSPFYKSYDETFSLKRLYPNIKFLHGGVLFKWMQRAKMVVLDHPATAMLEALTINIPCVFYWDHNVSVMKKEAEPYFEILRSAGIVYKDPLSAGKKVNEVFDRALDWWQSKAVQDARKLYCQRYAYTQKSWCNIWVKEFNQYIKNTEKIC